MKTLSLPVFKKCSEISIYNFLMVGVTGDMRFLIKEFDAEPDSSFFIEYKNSEDLKAIFKELEKEYKLLIADKKMLRREKEYTALLELNTRYSLANHILTVYEQHGTVEVLDIFNSVHGLSFHIKSGLSFEIDKITKKLYGWKNQLKIMEVNFKNKYKIDDKKDDEPDASSLLANIDKKALFFELNLETGYRIDPRKTDVIRWVNLEERSNAKLEKNG
jgi:hypothetical protein